jgi:hypothetical protein
VLEHVISVIGWVISEGTRESLTGSSKILFELFLKIFDIRNEGSLKAKVKYVHVTSDSRQSRTSKGKYQRYF